MLSPNSASPTSTNMVGAIPMTETILFKNCGAMAFTRTRNPSMVSLGDTIVLETCGEALKRFYELYGNAADSQRKKVLVMLSPFPPLTRGAFAPCPANLRPILQ
jgi:hypothetical protein